MDGTSQASLEIVTHNYAPFNAAVAKYIEKLVQPDPRVASQAFREKARGVGHVLRALGIAALLTLIGASLVVLCQQRSATAPGENNAGVPSGWPINLPAPSQTAVGGKIVIDPYLFTTVPVAEGVDVVTGWKFAKSTDERPESQFCHLRMPEEFGRRIIPLADLSQSGELLRQSSAGTFNRHVQEIDYETALGKCVWFSSK